MAQGLSPACLRQKKIEAQPVEKEVGGRLFDLWLPLAADCDDGTSAGLELVCVGEFAATTTIKMIREIPMAPGTQFFKCSQSRRGPHRRMLNSRHFKRGPLDARP